MDDAYPTKAPSTWALTVLPPGVGHLGGIHTILSTAHGEFGTHGERDGRTSRRIRSAFTT